MILDTDNKSKSFLLFFLVFISSALIIWQYFKLNPWQTINNEDSNLSSVTESIGETFLEIGDSWNLAKDFTFDSKNDFKKELQKQRLLDETKKYLENKNNNVE